MVVELEIRRLLRLTRPEINVWLVPNLEVPLRYLIYPVPLDQMLCKCPHQRIPLRIVLGRRNILLVPERMNGLRIRSQLVRHKADLDKWPHTLIEQPIVDLIHIGEVVDRLPVARLAKDVPAQGPAGL